MRKNPIRFIAKKIRNVKYKSSKQDFILHPNEPLQIKGKQISQEVFNGGPIQKFSAIGRLYLITLLKNGLTPDSKVLDIGCGALRGGYWLIHFLNPGCYFGLEPNKTMLEAGKRILLEDETLTTKQPRFDHNSNFDLSVFGETFDYVIARSIWTHTSKSQICKMLDEFVINSTPNGVFLTSYLKPYFKTQDYLGGEWIGRSHESDTAGVVFHDFSWIQNECNKRQLKAEELKFDYVDQIWIRISKV